MLTTLLASLALLITLLLIFVIRDFFDTARRTSSTNNLKHMGIVFNVYANNTPDGQYPPPTSRAALAVSSLANIFPEHLTSLSVMLVPSWDKGYRPFEAAEKNWPTHLDDAESIVAANQVYFSYAFSTEDELNLLLDSIPELAKNYPQPIERPGTTPILPLGEAKRLSLEVPPKVQSSKTIIMFENPLLNNGSEDIINVLYLNGAVRMVPRKEFFPNANFTRLATGSQSENR